MESNKIKVALVTGANKGIGFAIVRKLAINYAKSSSGDVPLTLYMTARAPNLGQESLEKIKQELKQKKILKEDGGIVTLKFLRLDLTDEQSIKDVEKVLAQDNGLDILINNAGMAFKGNTFDANVVRTTLTTNFYGTLNVSNHFYPLIRPHGRLINVSSMGGALRVLSPKLQKEFSREDLTMGELIALMKKFEDDVQNNRWKEEGWPIREYPAYSVSKVGVTAMTKIFARRAEAESKNILIHACCPGWVETDMTAGLTWPGEPKTPDQGAETPVLLALDENVVPKAKNGELWQHEKITPW